ncbi:hypothetical protein RhiirA4_475681 [Rhizophagus irregularis]|uniref:Uncharacterized protein n=1 Tax=Rhizophagus irregularis TaxID=588596 RepID=A0A2I1HAJ7_9GLOM|nr:hypothetical protein RhiirA4_475681 [Rhizophagus irregularis]
MPSLKYGGNDWQRVALHEEKIAELNAKSEKNRADTTAENAEPKFKVGELKVRLAKMRQINENYELKAEVAKTSMSLKTELDSKKFLMRANIALPSRSMFIALI